MKTLLDPCLKAQPQASMQQRQGMVAASVHVGNQASNQGHSTSGGLPGLQAPLQARYGSRDQAVAALRPPGATPQRLPGLGLYFQGRCYS